MILNKIKLPYIFVSLLSVVVLKIFTEVLKLIVNNNVFINSLVQKIGSLNGIYTQSATNWNPTLDKLINLFILVLLFFLLKNFNYKENKPLPPVLIILTFVLGSLIFSSNILINDYRGWDLFLYCEINPRYVDSNPYLKDINGLTSVYSPIVWDFLYKICNIGLVNKIIYSYYIWVYTGFGILIIFLIRNQNINLKNIFINVGIALTFLGTNYHGIKTGNVGYILGFLIAYFFSINSDKSKSKLSSIIMGFLLMIKPFYLFWFGILYISTKLLKVNIKIFTI